MARQVRRALAEGLEPRDVAVLSLGGQTKAAFAKVDAIGETPVRRADAVDADEHVVADTFLRFKGLERPFVIVTELGLGKQQYDVRMHIALTRATVECVVVATESELGADPRLAAVAAAAAASPASPSNARRSSPARQ